jgi:hypothetical protein
VKKSELKNGMLVLVKYNNNEEWFVYIDKGFYSLTDMSALSLSSYDEDFNTTGIYKITKIANVDYIGDIFRTYKNGTVEALTKTILYEIPNARVAEIKRQMNILQSELNTLEKPVVFKKPNSIKWNF